MMLEYSLAEGKSKLNDKGVYPKPNAALKISCFSYVTRRLFHWELIPIGREINL